MTKIATASILLISSLTLAQQVKIEPLLNDEISIRAIQIWKSKVWYAGSKSKIGYVDWKNPKEQRQIKLATNDLEFRTLAQNGQDLYAVNIGSPAYFYKINPRSLEYRIVNEDREPTAFYDALRFVDSEYAIAFSDPNATQKLNISLSHNGGEQWKSCGMCEGFPLLAKGEAAFAASNSNIASVGKYVWIATGGTESKIYRMKNRSCNWEVFPTSVVQGTSSQGIYSIDFADASFGIAVGGDYTQQAENVNNIATTEDGGQTWQIQASGRNAGYSTCVKIKPKSKGREIIALGDQHISYSKDFGRTWTVISEEKGFYTAEWLDSKSLILAGKNKIVRLRLED